MMKSLALRVSGRVVTAGDRVQVGPAEGSQAVIGNTSPPPGSLPSIRSARFVVWSRTVTRNPSRFSTSRCSSRPIPGRRARRSASRVPLWLRPGGLPGAI
jgi:hypothetical protein